MPPLENYVYCPFCATRLVRRMVFNQARPSCPQCGFIHFHDPKVAVIAFVICARKLLLVRRAPD